MTPDPLTDFADALPNQSGDTMHIFYMGSDGVRYVRIGRYIYVLPGRIA